MSFDFGRLRFGVRKPERPKVERLSDEVVIELWEERAAIQQTENTELIHWHLLTDSPAAVLRRHCELIAAADMSMQLGVYVETIIRPLLTKCC